eukprot:c38918_g1_i1 orf=93-245(+)
MNLNSICLLESFCLICVYLPLGKGNVGSLLPWPSIDLQFLVFCYPPSLSS